MSVFRNRSGCNCGPRQPNLYKEMKRKIGKLNYSDDWAFSKIPDYPFINEEIEVDKLAYEVCCKNRKKRVRTPGKEHLTLSQHEGLEKSKSSLRDPNGRLLEIYGSPLAQRFSIVNKKPKWREEHEKRLQEEAKAEEEKYIVTRWQNVVKNQEAQDKFRRLQELNQKQSFRWRLEKEQVLRQSEKDLYGQENPKEKKEKSTPEQIEKDLMKTFCKMGIIRKYMTKVHTIPPKVVLNTPLGKYLKKSHKNQNKKRKAQKSTFDQMLRSKDTKVPKFYSLRESQPLLVKAQTNKTTHVGAKFSWTFRRMVKAKDVHKPKMSKPFDKLIKGKNVEIPELMPALKSRDKILTERNLKEENKEMVKKPVIPSSKSQKSRRRDEFEPNYGVYTIDKSRHLPPGDIKPKFSEHFINMLRGKEKIPELNEALMSHHEILPDMKGAGKAASGPRKSRPKKESEPSYGVSKTKKAKHSPSGDIKPKISQQFHKMLRGKEKKIPELNEALMSHHEILTDMRRPRKSKPKNKSQTIYELKRTEKSRDLPSGDINPTFSEHHDIVPDVNLTGYESELSYGEIRPKLSEEFNETLCGLDATTYEPNDALLSHHEIFPEKETTRKSISRSRKGSIRNKIESTRHKGLQKFDYYIRHSLPDWRIVRQRGSKDAIPYLNRKSIASVISEKSDLISSRKIAEKAEKTAPSDSIIRTAEVAQSFLPVREKEAEDVELRDNTLDIMSDTIPEGYGPQHMQDPSLKNSLIEFIASIAKADKAEKISKSKVWLKPENGSSSEQKACRSNSISLKSMSDDFKKYETLEEHSEQEQYQEEFVLEDKAVVQARIQELMKFVVIREDFQPPKPPRNFIRENIEMLQKMRPRKKAQVKKRGKPKENYPISMQKQTLAEGPDFCESLCRNPNQQWSDKEYGPMKKLCQHQQDQYQTNPKAPAVTVDKEDPKCDLFNVLSGYSKPEDKTTKISKKEKKGRSSD